MVPEAPRGAVGHRIAALQRLLAITQAELAGRLGVAQPFLSQMTHGTRPVPDSILVRASAEFGLPTSFFMVQPSPAEIGQVTFRKSSRASVRDENRVVALYDEAARVFRAASELSGYRAADLPDPRDFDSDAELVAEAMREEAGLAWDEPVLNATRTIERAGVGVVDNLDHLDEGAAGHTAVSRPSRYNDRPLVALVAEVPGEVKRLTVLHELGHLIFDRDLVVPIRGLRSSEERRAYRFAGAFLLPERVVRVRVSESLNLHGYLPIKAEYGMSVSAIVLRARDLGVISAARARSLQIQLSSQGWRHNEPVPVADEKPLLLGQALRRVYGKQMPARAAHVHGVAPEWIQRWTHAESGTAELAPGKVIDLARRRRSG